MNWATKKSIAEHLGIDENLLELDKIDDYYKVLKYNCNNDICRLGSKPQMVIN